MQLYIPSEVSHDTISELAEMGNFQFKDVCDGLVKSRVIDIAETPIFTAKLYCHCVPTTLHPSTPSFG